MITIHKTITLTTTKYNYDKQEHNHYLDNEGNVFGGYCSSSWKPGEGDCDQGC